MAIVPGSKAPDFTLRSQHGERVRLSDFSLAGNPGHPGDARNVVLLFYPFAFTGTCTGELRALRDRLPLLVDDEVQLLAVSADSPFSLRVFADQEGLEYPLLSDFWPHGEVARAYEVFDEEKGCALRGTFIIDKEGVVRWTVVNGLSDARDPDEYVAALRAL